MTHIKKPQQTGNPLKKKKSHQKDFIFIISFLKASSFSTYLKFIITKHDPVSIISFTASSSPTITNRDLTNTNEWGG